MPLGERATRAAGPRPGQHEATELERLGRERLMLDVDKTRARYMVDKAHENRAAEIEISCVKAKELAALTEVKASAARRLRDLDSQVLINRERRRLARKEFERVISCRADNLQPSAAFAAALAAFHTKQSRS